MTERLTLTVSEAAKILGISRTQAYDAIKRKELPSIRFGRRILIPRVSFEKLIGVQNHEAAAAEEDHAGNDVPRQPLVLDERLQRFFEVSMSGNPRHGETKIDADLAL